MTSDEKLLVLDIETAPVTAYVWRLWDQNVGLNQIIDNGGILCVGAKWVGKHDTFRFSEWDYGKLHMLQQIHGMMSEADAVITYNGDAFDLKKLNGEFALYGLPPLPPLTSIDVLKSVKKLGLISNKLAFVGPLFKVGAKIKHEGFDLWKDVMNGEEKAQTKMEKYCIQDVRLLEKLYKRLRAYMPNHPHLGATKKECGACGSNHVQSRGYRRTKHFRIQRVQCQSCGSWAEGVRERIK